MEPVTMTADELREYIRHLPEDVILRLSIQEDKDDTEENETV